MRDSLRCAYCICTCELTGFQSAFSSKCTVIIPLMPNISIGFKTTRLKYGSEICIKHLNTWYSCLNSMLEIIYNFGNLRFVLPVVCIYIELQILPLCSLSMTICCPSSCSAKLVSYRKTNNVINLITNVVGIYELIIATKDTNILLSFKFCLLTLCILPECFCKFRLYRNNSYVLTCSILMGSQYTYELTGFYPT
jgi:hypothetical protein